MSERFAIEMRGITKTFCSVTANKDVNLTLRQGEILALLGENGSGKTTLMNMLSGIYKPDKGEILVDGTPVSIDSPEDSKRLGIGMVHQHFKLVDVFSAADNIWMGKEKAGFTLKKDRFDQIQNMAKKFGFDIDPKKKVRNMAVSEKQTLEIIKVLYYGAKVIILDEPTAVLTVQEIDKLFGVLRRMKEEGHSIIIITGTANLIMAAVLAEGTTTIYNAACEPYIQQLCRMLISMGAKIEGMASNLLKITGVEKLGGTTHTMQPDMIEVGSFIGIAAMTGSELTLNNVDIKELGIIPNAFGRMGITVEQIGNNIHIPEHDSYQIETFIDGSTMTFADAPWPGLSPDLLSIFLVVATQANGSVLIHQKMFESRLFFVDKLIDMGARIILCDPHRAAVIGSGKLHSLYATNMVSPDIRAGVAMLMAAMAAKGTSRIQNINQIDRGYERIDERLNKLGANIIRIND